MHGTDAFQVEGVVIGTMPNGTYRVELANSHRLLAFVPGRAKKTFVRLSPGNRVKLQLSPYDLSTGRVVVGERC